MGDMLSADVPSTNVYLFNIHKINKNKKLYAVGINIMLY